VRDVFCEIATIAIEDHANTLEGTVKKT
jgi:hypothetical protein